jgi:hypothetical protein
MSSERKFMDRCFICKNDVETIYSITSIYKYRLCLTCAEKEFNSFENVERWRPCDEMPETSGTYLVSNVYPPGSSADADSNYSCDVDLNEYDAVKGRWANPIDIDDSADTYWKPIGSAPEV